MQDERHAETPLILFASLSKDIRDPSYIETKKNQPIIPIFASTREFLQGVNPCTRSQFLLTIAFAITVHKSQVLTMQKAVVDISRPQFTPGLNYVAISRLKSLEGLLFEKPFDLDTIKKRGSRENGGIQGFGLESTFKSGYFFVIYQFLISMFNLMVEFLILRTVFWIKPLKISKTINVGAIMVRLGTPIIGAKLAFHTKHYNLTIIIPKNKNASNNAFLGSPKL